MGAALSLQPWLSETLRGDLGVKFGGDPALQLGVLHKPVTKTLTVSSNISLQPDAVELAGRFKYKPVKGFHVLLEPLISLDGWAVAASCCGSLPDGLTKLQWTLRLRSRSVGLQFSIIRSGLRFAIPLELWHNTLGPLPLHEAFLALAIWIGVPLTCRYVMCIARRGGGPKA